MKAVYDGHQPDRPIMGDGSQDVLPVSCGRRPEPGNGGNLSAIKARPIFQPLDETSFPDRRWICNSKREDVDIGAQRHQHGHDVGIKLDIVWPSMIRMCQFTLDGATRRMYSSRGFVPREAPVADDWLWPAN